MIVFYRNRDDKNILSFIFVCQCFIFFRHSFLNILVLKTQIIKILRASLCDSIVNRLKISIKFPNNPVLSFELNAM